MSSYVLLTKEEKEAIGQNDDLIFAKQKPFYIRLLTHTNSKIALVILALLIAFALFGPLFSPYSYTETNLPDKNLSPSLTHPFGTDDLGRDLFTRVAYGLRLSLQISCIAAIVDLFLGVTWGTIAGYNGGTIDQIMMRIAEMVYSMPYLLFVILITVIIGPGFFPIIAAMVLIGWIQMARITRNLVLALRNQEFVIAALTLGIPTWRILLYHILPNCIGPIIALMMLTIPQAIFMEAFLSFLGIGIQPPQASLGSLVSDALGAMRIYPWRLFIPAVFISTLIFACNLLGDSLRELLDPQARINT